MEAEAEKIFQKHQGTIKDRAHKTGDYSVHDMSTEQGRRGAALDYVHDTQVTRVEDDDSEGEIEYDNAKIEEVEDQLLQAHAKAQKRPLQQEEITRISMAVSQIDLNESIVSTVQGKEPMHHQRHHYRPGNTRSQSRVSSSVGNYAANAFGANLFHQHRN